MCPLFPETGFSQSLPASWWLAAFDRIASRFSCWEGCASKVPYSQCVGPYNVGILIDSTLALLILANIYEISERIFAFMPRCLPVNYVGHEE